jgi:hypothetical protein
MHEMHETAPPFDVRWWLRPTVSVRLENWGCAPKMGVAQFVYRVTGRAKPFRTSGGEAAALRPLRTCFHHQRN